MDVWILMEYLIVHYYTQPRTVHSIPVVTTLHWLLAGLQSFVWVVGWLAASATAMDGGHQRCYQ